VALSGDDLKVTEVQDAPAAFVRGGLADDHPLATAFSQSLESGVAKRLSVSDPELAEKLIRRYANTRDLGVRILKDASTITIKATQKKQFPGRNKDEAPAETAAVVPDTAVPPSAEDFLNSDEER
jgi:hypothetical protein